MPMSVKAAVRDLELGPGDVAILNDPYRGGTHLPDVTVVAPVVLGAGGRPDFYVANRAHHADMGGATPGSMAPCRELLQEGLVIPPVRLVRAGELDLDLLALVLANIRAPSERRGDLDAQLAALSTGIARLRSLVSTHTLAAVRAAARALPDYTERMVRAAIEALPDGVYRFSDALDDDGLGGPGPTIDVSLDISGSDVTLDFSGSSPQVPGNVNAVFAVTVSAVAYVFRCLAPAHTPSNSGVHRPLTVVAPEGSVVNARTPAGVAAGNVETSQRIVDVVLGALSVACPDRIPAASAGTMTNIAFGGVHSGSGEPFTYYETVAGGMGGRQGAAGLDGVHTHMTNTMNTPIEALEHALPVQVERYALRRRSGGAGAFKGGDGIIRRIRFLDAATVSVLADRHRRAPYGLAGGEPGKTGATYLIKGGRRRRIASKVQLQVDAGDAVELRTPGGGGWGKRQ